MEWQKRTIKVQTKLTEREYTYLINTIENLKIVKNLDLTISDILRMGIQAVGRDIENFIQ